MPCLEYHGQFNWINPKTLSFEQHYHRRKIRESLKSKKPKPRKIENRGEGNLVKTNTWNPLFVKLIEKKTKQRLDIKFQNGFASILYFSYL